MWDDYTTTKDEFRSDVPMSQYDDFKGMIGDAVYFDTSLSFAGKEGTRPHTVCTPTPCTFPSVHC